MKGLLKNWTEESPLQSEAIDVFGVPQSEAIDVLGVPQCEAIDAENVPSLAPTFELQKHFSGCIKIIIVISNNSQKQFYMYSLCLFSELCL